MKHYKLLLYIIALSVMASCMRRPFGQFATEVRLDLHVKTEIEHEMVKIPEPDVMMVLFCNPVTGEIESFDLVSPEGGKVYPEPGTYDVLVYNMKLESTQILNDDNLFAMEATTNEISAFDKQQLESLLKRRHNLLEELYLKQLEEAAKSGQDALKQAEADVLEQQKLKKEELIVNEPDHVFVARKENVVIPQLAAGESFRMTLDLTAETLVETWHVKFTNVNGVEYVTNTVGLMTGLHQSVRLWDQKKSENQVTVFFRMGRGQDKKSLFGTFHTFGKHPAYDNGLTVDIGIMNMAGQNDVYHYDVSDQFNEQNTNHLILIEDEITIKEPEGGGGFKPEVEDWEDIETDVII